VIESIHLAPDSMRRGFGFAWLRLAILTLFRQLPDGSKCARIHSSCATNHLRRRHASLCIGDHAAAINALVIKKELLRELETWIWNACKLHSLLSLVASRVEYGIAGVVADLILQLCGRLWPWFHSITNHGIILQLERVAWFHQVVACSRQVPRARRDIFQQLVWDNIDAIALFSLRDSLHIPVAGAEAMVGIWEGL